MTPDRVTTIEQIRYRPSSASQAPAAATDTTLFTATVQTWMRGRIFIAERGGAAAVYRLAIRPLGITLAVAHYLAFDAPLTANQSLVTEELFFRAGDICMVRSDTGDVSFNFIGLVYPLEASI